MEEYRFRFYDHELQRKYVALAEIMNIDFTVEHDGTLLASESDSLLLDDLECAVRTSQLGEWHCWNISRPKGNEYLQYANDHKIPFVVEWDGVQEWLVLRREDSPDSWGIERRIDSTTGKPVN